MAATYTKYNQFVEDLTNKVHDLFGTAGSTADTCKVALTNTAPTAASNKVLADITEISAGNGYSAGGNTAANAGTRSTTTITVVGTSFNFTASGGSIGPFRYAVIYNSTAASGPLIAYWDYGSSITLANGESFSVLFNSVAVKPRHYFHIELTMKDCCLDPSNRELVSSTPDSKVEVCKVCSCRHFSVDLDPGKFGLVCS